MTRRALPRARTIGLSAASSFAWGMAMVVTVAAGLWLRGRIGTFHLPTIFVLFFAGGFFGWWLTALIGRRVARYLRSPLVLGGLAALGLAAATVFFTAAFFALQYRVFYAQWHAPVLSRAWMLQFAFTSASAFYQFAILALRLYLPLGPVVLIGGAWAMSRHMR